MSSLHWVDQVRCAWRQLEELLAGMMSPHYPLRLNFRRSRGRFAAFTLVGVLGVALLTFLPSFIVPTHAAANSRAPGGNFANPVVRAIDIAEPAIVRLATLYEGQVELDLCGQAVMLPAGGNGYTLGGLGSGAFISANGEILTADHVVHIDKASLDDEIFQGQTSSSDIASAINAHASCLGINYRVTTSNIANGYLQDVGIPYKTTYSDPRSLVWQATSFTGPVIATSSDGILKALTAASYQEAKLVTSSTFEENDLAVLRVGLTDTPSIQLDDSTAVAVEDQLTIIGFPGNGDVSGNVTDLLTPSVNTVMVSAIKSGTNGAKLIQVGGNVEHGDSGGPALDAGGHIVGVVSFGGIDPRGSTAFMRTSNNARSLITSAGLDLRPGTFQTLWEQAFADYTSTAPGHWHKAASELDSLSTRYPSFKGIQEYKKFADFAAQTESASGVDVLSQPSMLSTVAVAIGVLLVVTLVIFFVARRRARPAVAPVAAMRQTPPSAPYGSAPYGGYPYAPPAGYGPYGGYGGNGGYGLSAPPSNFHPMNGNSYVPGEGVAASPAMTPEVAGPSTLQELAVGGPSGRMSLPPSSAHGMASFDGASPTSHSVVGVEAPKVGDATPAAYLPSVPAYARPQASSAPSWSNSQGADGAAAASQYYCVNGHSLSPGEIYCTICGAPRRPDLPYSQYSSHP